MQRISLALLLALIVLGTAACGPNPGGKLPVTSPIYQFQAPDADEFEDEDAVDTDSAAQDTPDSGDEE